MEKEVIVQASGGTEVLNSNLNTFFYPKSVAVAGVTRMEGTVPHDLFGNILKSKFGGIVYPVSPGSPSINGVKAYKYILDIPDPVDLAVIVFPSQVCSMALKQCGKKGVKAAVIISAGFKEIGAEGEKKEQELKDIAAEYGISLIGPNCLGVINTDPAVNLNASFARKMPLQGSIAFLSQSGALCTAVLDYAEAKHIGFSKFISFGNKAGVSEIDLLYYLKDDPLTKVILLYLEEITDGRALMQAARHIYQDAQKPLLILKSGRTKQGAAAAASHTGSLAGSDEICSSAFKQAGILRCSNIEEMFDAAIAFDYQPLPKGKRTAIITNAGGPGVLAADSVINEGLILAEFQPETTAALKKLLPKTANINNPVDIIGDARADRYKLALENIMNDQNTDSVFVILTPQSMTEIEKTAETIVRFSREGSKPVYTSFMGEADVSTGVEILLKNNVPHYILPESMSRASAKANMFREYILNSRKPDGFRAENILKPARSLTKDRRFLNIEESASMLKAAGIPVAAGRHVFNLEEAEAAAEEIGYPVVIKIISDAPLHKSDIKGVKLNIINPAELRNEYASLLNEVLKILPETSVRGIYVQKMEPEGIEYILGLKKDPSFGTVMMFGSGGTLVELYNDVVFRIPPLNDREIDEMISEVKGSKLLQPFRGSGKKDKACLIETIKRLQWLADNYTEIDELDINPLIVNEEGMGCKAVDARIVLA